MTLDQLWQKVNSEYSKVKSASSYTSLELWDRVWIHGAYVQDYLWWIDSQYSPDLRESMWRMRTVTEHVLALIKEGYAILENKIDATHFNLQDLFHRYMENIVDYIKQAVNLVWNEAAGGGGGLREYIDDAISGVQYQLSSEIHAVVNMVDSEISGVKNLVTQKYNEVKGWVESTFGGVWDWITESVDDIWQRSKDYAMQLFADAEIMIAAIYDDLGDAILAVRTSMINYYYKARQYAETLFTQVTDFINTAIGDLERTIDTVRGEIKAWVDRQLAEVMKNVLVVVDTVQEVIDQLSILVDWRFRFFNWFVRRPELSMLKVLIRSDEDFNYYKPYWQAFIARVLEET